MTHRIEHFVLRCLKELNLFELWLKELNTFWYDPKNWFFFSKIRLKALTKNDSKKWFFSIDSKIELFKMTQVFQFDSKDWTFEVWFKELNLFSIRLTELRIVFFLQFDSKNWMWHKELNLFFSMTQGIEFFF